MNRQQRRSRQRAQTPKARVLTSIPAHLLRHYPGPLAGVKYAELERFVRRSGVRITWWDIEQERLRRKR